MTVLYKYLQKQYADLLIKRGKLRIGTLYEYRDIEKHGTIVGDEDEGKKSLYMDVASEKWTADNQPDFTKGLIKIANGSSVHMEDVTFQKSESSPDYYLYCTTEKFDENALKDFGYDACVVIEKPNLFFAAITRTLRHKGTFEGTFCCQYVSRRVEYDKDHGIHPAIIKDPSYKDQKEIRTLWKPFKTNISPLVIDCRDAAKYCRML
ncbi:MAG TPA: hypothetical protein VEP71_04335 [Gallionella sp.]|nr:hypothetical protein [Gallionella sp.]